jgi:hypothetical protein
MLLHCLRVLVLFPREQILLENQGPARMLWTEHGGTLILKVGDLKFAETTAPGEESGFFLELGLPAPADLVPKIEEFAAEQSLSLAPPAPPAAELSLPPILAACHLPQLKKFIFAEDARLEARPGKSGGMAMKVQGEFRSRTVPCQEGDLVIHLQPREMAQLLAFLRNLARSAGGAGS